MEKINKLISFLLLAFAGISAFDIQSATKQQPSNEGVEIELQDFRLKQKPKSKEEVKSEESKKQSDQNVINLEDIKRKEIEQPLLDAVKANDLKMAKAALKKANLIAKNKALIVATMYGNTAIVNLLLKHGADINAVDINGKTALMIACSDNKTDIVKLLLEYGADIDDVDKQSWLSLKKLAHKNQLKELLALIAKAETVVNAVNEYAQNLFRAYETADFAKFDIYLNQFSLTYPHRKPTLLKNKEKNTLLHEAVIKGDRPFVVSILKDCPQLIPDLLNMPNKDGMTPIDLAASNDLLTLFMDFAYPAK